ncbi:MAG: hypothetical protein ACRC62_08960 [Microcoleus sp.]
MNSKFFTVIIAVLSVTIALIISAQSDRAVSEIYVFGDSLSDMGNMTRAIDAVYLL